MNCGTHFRMLLFIVAYASYTNHVSCNNESPKIEIHESSGGKMITNSTNSNNSIGLDNKRSDVGVSETQSSNGINPISLEGGSTVVLNLKNNDLSTTTRKSVQSESLNDKGLQLESDQYTMGDANPSTDHKPHKGRKGVVQEVNSEESITEYATLDAAKISKQSSTVQPVNNTTNVTISTIVSAYNAMNASSGINLGSNKTNSLEQPTQLAVPVTNMTVNSNSTTAGSKSGEAQEGKGDNKTGVTEMPPPRQKPEVTRDDTDVDDPLSYSSYSLTLTGNDYVIPIVATIFAAPLLIVLAMFLYKRSKEFWERRHYRRMDFLIDGMYND